MVLDNLEAIVENQETMSTPEILNTCIKGAFSLEEEISISIRRGNIKCPKNSQSL